MVLKTFNVDDESYKKFSEFCRENGISMSKQVDFFMKSIVEDEPKVKDEYLKKLDRIRKQRSIPVGNFSDLRKRYG
ncbi:MAG: hypothetical protein ACLFTR_05650 [Candidatus Woesearchaeota archaeon]